MKVVEHKVPFLIFDVPAHSEIKPLVISAIDSMGTYSYKNKQQVISHTDWHLSANFNRPYYDLVIPSIADIITKVNDFYKYPEPLQLDNYWFQKYEKGDSHGWHTHPKSLLNAVYFLSLPKGSLSTTFKLLDEEFSIDVKEGQVLVFPAVYQHCSKPNKSDAAKIVIAFNLQEVV